MESLQVIEILACQFVNTLWMFLSLIGITNDDDFEYFSPYIHDIENAINAFKNAYNTYYDRDNCKMIDEDLDNIDEFYEQMDLDMSDNEIEFIELQNELINITNENIMYPAEQFRNTEDPLRILYEMECNQHKPTIISSIVSECKNVIELSDNDDTSEKAQLTETVSSTIENTKKASKKKRRRQNQRVKKEIMTLEPIKGQTKKSEKKWGDCSDDDISESPNTPIKITIVHKTTHNPVNRFSPFKPLMLNNLPKSPKYSFDPKVKTVVQEMGITYQNSTCVNWTLGLCNNKYCPKNFSHSLWTDYNTGYSNMKFWKPNDLSEKNITYTELKSYKGTKYYRSEKIMSEENTYIISERNNNGIYCVKNYLIYISLVKK